MMSISGGQPPVAGSSQKAGQKPWPEGRSSRASKYPYCWANEVAVVMMPEL